MISAEAQTDEIAPLAERLYVAIATSRETREAIDGGEDPEVLCREHARFAWGAAATFFDQRPIARRAMNGHQRQRG